MARYHVPFIMRYCGGVTFDAVSKEDALEQFEELCGESDLDMVLLCDALEVDQYPNVELVEAE